MDVVVWSVAAIAALAGLGFAVYRLYRFYRTYRIYRGSRSAPPAPQQPVEKNAYTISYVRSDIEWSGSSTSVLPLKVLTFKQYECLEDARYGFRIVGVKPSQRKEPQPHKTRVHGLRTVASLVRHEFLMSSDPEGGHAITDLGLNALEVCDVRY